MFKLQTLKNEFSGLIDTGTYYMNNRNTGGFLKRSGTTLSAQSGVLMSSTTKTPYQWTVTKINNSQYTIQPANDLTKYLVATPATGSVSLNGYATYWNARTANGGGIIFTVAAPSTTYALAIVNGTIKLQTLVSTSGSAAYNRQVWTTPNVYCGGYVAFRRCN